MRLIDLCVFCVLTFFLWGIWQFIWLFLLHFSYSNMKESGERFLDFCVRSYDSIFWRIRKKLHIDWFYNSKAFTIYVIFRGVVLLGIVVFSIVAFFVIKERGLIEFLYEKF